MSEIELLSELGLSIAEAKVYLAVLELGSTLAGPIIKKTNLHRGTAYSVLQRLIEKGFISYLVKGKKRYFEAANPKRLMDLLKEKEEKLELMLPQLLAKKQSSENKQEITVYSGTKGIRTVFDNIFEELKSDGTYYDFGVSGLFKELMPSYWESWQKRKKKYNIKSQVIFNESIKNSDPELLKNYYGEKKFHPKEFLSFTDTIIFNDTIVLFIWTAKPPIAVMIQNKENAKSYLNQFKLMWKTCKR